MKAKRLNAYQKALAMKEMKHVYHSYTGHFRALKDECISLFDAYEAEPFKKQKYLNYDLRTVERLQKHHERFNRQSSLTMNYSFYYDCQFEKEAERLKIVKCFFIEMMERLYKDELELIQSIKGGLIEGIHYELTIEKNK